MPASVARTAPRWTVRSAPVCHDGRCMPPHSLGRAVPRHVPLGEPQSDAWAGELERGPEVVTCRGKWFAAAAVLPCLRALAARQTLPGRVVRRGKLLLGCLGLAFPASSSRRGLGASAWSSRQAPLAGVLSPWPGELLLPGPRLLGPAISSCRGLVFLAQILGLRLAQRGAVEVLGVPLASH